ncbi:MAG: 50S ribosomal protein L29 [Flavobacteriia bacterium]|jgi:large subunit ribosomal protein L29|nr:50S ribosomal protein L29 [Flavobacteriia bacterium]
MKQQEISKLSVEDLKTRLVNSSETLTKMKIGHSVTPLENPLQIRDVRRTIARLNTELKKRETQA